MNSKKIKFPTDWMKSESPGFGTYPGSSHYQNLSAFEQAVTVAVESGYTHIDHAQAYNNDEFVGKGLANIEERERFFITSKLLPENNSFKGACDGIRKVLSGMRLDYLDMFLIHYPGVGDPIEAWRGLLQANKEGLCRHIGVSNFEIKHLNTFHQVFGKYPEVNQIEFQPYLYGPELQELVTFCHQNGIALEGYCLSAWCLKDFVDFSVIDRIAYNQKKTRTQILVKWCMQHKIRPLIGSKTPAHIRDNFGPYDFTLSNDEMTALNLLGKNLRCSLSWGWDPTSVDEKFNKVA